MPTAWFTTQLHIFEAAFTKALEKIDAPLALRRRYSIVRSMVENDFDHS